MLYKKFFNLIRTNRDSWYSRLIGKYSLKLYKAYENDSFDFITNGEAWLIEKVACGARTVFDVGAHEGMWTKLFLSKNSDTQVYAFELIKETYEVLCAKLAGQNNVCAYNLGLSDQNRTCEAEYFPNKNYVSRIYMQKNNPVRRAQSTIIEAQLVTGSDFCLKHNIDHMDFLKIDTEGHDYYVLLGLERLIRNDAIDIIQFEYGRANIYNKTLLLDFYELLSSNYYIGKLYPKYIWFKDYSSRDENFLGPNYVCVNKTKTTIYDRLKRD